MTILVGVRGLSKSFRLHTQGGAEIDVFNDVSLDVRSGKCVCLHGPIRVRQVDVAAFAVRQLQA